MIESKLIIAEYVFRPDLVHITLFNLTMERNQKYYGLDEDIMTWIDDNWDLLQVKEVRSCLDNTVYMVSIRTDWHVQTV